MPQAYHRAVESPSAAPGLSCHGLLHWGGAWTLVLNPCHSWPEKQDWPISTFTNMDPAAPASWVTSLPCKVRCWGTILEETRRHDRAPAAEGPGKACSGFCLRTEGLCLGGSMFKGTASVLRKAVVWLWTCVHSTNGPHPPYSTSNE